MGAFVMLKNDIQRADLYIYAQRKRHIKNAPKYAQRKGI